MLLGLMALPKSMVKAVFSFSGQLWCFPPAKNSEHNLFQKKTHLLIFPQPNNPFTKELNDLFFNFPWSGKRDKIKTNVLNSDFSHGVLKI